VQDEGIDVRAEISDQERHPMNHQAREEMNITGQPVQLGDGDRTALRARFLKRGGKLRSPVDGIGPFAGLDLDVYATQRKAFGSGERFNACFCVSTTIVRPLPAMRTSGAVCRAGRRARASRQVSVQRQTSLRPTIPSGVRPSRFVDQRGKSAGSPRRS
jgi:hypothetical protein